MLGWPKVQKVVLNEHNLSELEFLSPPLSLSLFLYVSISVVLSPPCYSCLRGYSARRLYISQHQSFKLCACFSGLISLICMFGIGTHSQCSYSYTPSDIVIIIPYLVRQNLDRQGSDLLSLSSPRTCSSQLQTRYKVGRERLSYGTMIAQGIMEYSSRTSKLIGDSSRRA